MHETLNCLQKQTIVNWECVIVNDGSTDNTLDVAKEYVVKDKRYILVDKQNGGLADARNVGIKSSHGKYILPLDSDDLIDPSYAEKAVNYMEEHPDVTLVYCRARYFGDRNDEWILPEYNFNRLLFGNMIFCSCVYRRLDYDKTEGYNINMKYGYEDWNFLLSLLKKESKVYQIPEILFFYRKHGESMLSNSSKHVNELYNQMISNHLDLYAPYFYNIIRAESEITYLKGEISKLLNSRKYKMGTMVLHPLTTIKRLISGSQL